MAIQEYVTTSWDGLTNFGAGTRRKQTPLHAEPEMRHLMTKPTK